MISGELTWHEVFEVFMLLLIGIGPKIALVPFIEMTATMDESSIKAVANKAVRTAMTWSLILALLGWFLMTMLHFTTGSVLVAGGIVLLLMALQMLIGGSKEEDVEEHPKDPMDMALYPLAVPYLLNPVGIAVLAVFSSQVSSILEGVILIVLILLVGLIDWLLFRNIKSIAKTVDKSKMAVTES
ncbi:MAG: MarC family protein, partial [Caldilineaceae bacterium]